MTLDTNSVALPPSFGPNDTPVSYDALLVVSFGGPEGMDDVIPFLENVLRGRNVPRERMMEVVEHYRHFDGISPINAQCRALIAALHDEFDAHHLDMPIYWGNRNWKPMLTDTLQQMADDGVQKVLAFITSPYSSYSSCRQYRHNIADALAQVKGDAPEVHIMRKWYNHPGFIEPIVEYVQTALEEIPKTRRDAAQLVFTAHSIPTAMAESNRYQAQLLEVARLVAEKVERSNWRLVYQSRSGPPSQSWLEPDIGDYLRELGTNGVEDVVVVPIGFISDHIEVLFDLDHEAQEIAHEVGINMIRAATVGTHPAFVSMIRELIDERTNAEMKGRFLGTRGIEMCFKNCCLYARPQMPSKTT
ncbi:MAG: ferrochelatase [Phototrophicales bacterium]|nr:MAG: ferrochelatase [Phototrophicales bacterium]